MAQMTAASINDLPDSDFAYIEPGGTKDDSGKTVPRSLRHYPIHDAAHVRNAMARAQQQMDAGGDGARIARAAMPKIMAAAKRMGIGDMGKAGAEPMKAEAMTGSRLDRWLRGDISRRILVVPFGGPLPKAGAPRGVDLDGEWFDEATDLVGHYPALRASRERFVDFHHDADPTGRMKGAILGRIVLDDEAEDDGRWADFWINAGEQRRKLIAQLEERGAALYGSSQAIEKKADALGHIELWPLIRHTITTSPQNTYAVVPPLKAVLTATDASFDEVGYRALQAAMLGLTEHLTDLRPTFPIEAADTFLDAGGDDAAKAGRVLSAKNEADLEAALAVLRAVIARMRGDLLTEEVPT